jgi:hypothetical protein
MSYLPVKNKIIFIIIAILLLVLALGVSVIVINAAGSSGTFILRAILVCLILAFAGLIWITVLFYRGLRAAASGMRVKYGGLETLLQDILEGTRYFSRGMTMGILEWVKHPRPFFVWIPAILWSFVILVLSLLPFDPESAGVGTLFEFDHFDKICHFSGFAVLAFLVMLGMERSGIPPDLKNGLFALILSSGYGILVEILQYFVSARQACFIDAASNVAGVLLGMLAGRLILWRK